MGKDEHIAVVGLGHVGLTTAAILAQCGYTVHAVDINKHRIDTAKKGKAFFYEKGLDALVRRGIESKKLLPTINLQEGISQATIVISCVGTPDNPDGSSNLSYVFDAAQDCTAYMKKGAIFVQKSTVPVGTGKQIEAVFRDQKADVSYVSNPEFLRESTAIHDTLWFERVVCGSRNTSAATRVTKLYESIEQHREAIAKICGIEADSPKKGLYITTSLNSAELIKVTANAFLALKISFANSIAKLADATGSDINDIMDAVGADTRIGRAFLNAGRGYGGGCFPKDVSGLIFSARSYGVDLPIMTAVAEVNDSMPAYIAERAHEALGELAGKKVAVLGLAFKAGTSDSRRSPGVKLANTLSQAGANTIVYDPKTNGEAVEELRRGIRCASSIEEAVADCDAVFIATDWPEFRSLDFEKLKQANVRLVFDCMNTIDKDLVARSGLQYLGVGRTINEESS